MPALSAAAAESSEPAPSGSAASRRSIGLELYSVRHELARDLPGTLRSLAAMGYNAVEFFAPYMEWTVPEAKEVRLRMDDLGLRCHSTHNHIESFTPGAAMDKAIEINQVLGTSVLVLASTPKGTVQLEDWKRLCGRLSTAVETLRGHGLTAGFHNHEPEWARIDGDRRIMDVIAAGTPHEFVLQFDVGTCVAAGANPVAWVRANPGRIRSIHLKDWAPGDAAAEKGYRVLFGEGVAPWREIVAAAEEVGGVEWYLLEQEGSRYSELETAQRCLQSWRQLHA